jgi:hypothetical protein
MPNIVVGFLLLRVIELRVILGYELRVVRVAGFRVSFIVNYILLQVIALRVTSYGGLRVFFTSLLFLKSYLSNLTSLPTS